MFWCEVCVRDVSSVGRAILTSDDFSQLALLVMFFFFFFAAIFNMQRYVVWLLHDRTFTPWKRHQHLVLFDHIFFFYLGRLQVWYDLITDRYHSTLLGEIIVALSFVNVFEWRIKHLGCGNVEMVVPVYRIFQSQIYHYWLTSENVLNRLLPRVLQPRHKSTHYVA